MHTEGTDLHRVNHDTNRQIAQKIAELRSQAERFEAKYGCDYETFTHRVVTEDGFAERIESDVDISWELDLIEWEFSHKGIDDWTRQLQSILSGQGSK